jgi:hypothetical protein
MRESQSHQPFSQSRQREIRCPKGPARAPHLLGQLDHDALRFPHVQATARPRIPRQAEVPVQEPLRNRIQPQGPAWSPAHPPGEHPGEAHCPTSRGCVRRTTLELMAAITSGPGCWRATMLGQSGRCGWSAQALPSHRDVSPRKYRRRFTAATHARHWSTRLTETPGESAAARR